MALVSPSLSPTSYGAAPPGFSRSSSSDPATPAQIRALPTLPTGAARRQGSQQSLGGSGGTSPAAQQARSLPQTMAGGRSPSAPPFVELATSRSVSPLPPAVGNRSTAPSRSSSTPSPSPYQQQHQHTLSASSSASSSAGSLPRLPPVHLVQGPKSAPPVPNGLVGVQQYPQHHQSHHPQHPSFVGHHPAFSAAPHAFPHPQYPFIPSPHPHAAAGGPGAALGYQPGPYSPGFSAPGAQAGTSAVSAESQHQARLVQQAHLQQQQWQMEMMRNQQQQQQQQGHAFDWQQQQQGQARRRATSGPAPPSHSPTYYTSPLPYPPSPSPTLHTKYLPNVGGGPALPPGAMLPQFGHGYPTPPGSVEGRENSREGYHPYRRGGAKGDHDASGRSASHPRAPTSSAMTHNPSGSSSSSQHQRNESASSALAAHNFPPLPGKQPSPSPVASSSSSSSAFTGASSTKHGNSSTTSVGSSTGTGGRTPPSARSTPPPPATVPLPPTSRTRTESQQSTSSSSSSREPHSRQYSSSSGSSSRRGESFDSARSATPVQGLNGKKPSPLSRQYQQAASVVSHGSSRPSSELERPGTPGTLRAGREEEDEDSDDTAGATIAPNSAGVLQGGVQGKEKDKKGMKSRFKKAFGGSSTPALSEGELDGRGPKAAERRRVDSASSTDSGAPNGHPRLASSSASVMGPTSSAASTSGSTRPPPSTSGRRLGMFNGKFNGSSDNLSISSTVSSASVMIRKLGNMGKIARRNSMMSLSRAFKSKDKEEDPSTPTKEELKQLKKDKRKGILAATAVSHATAEVESPSRVNGMSPAAALAKKHQQQYAEQEAAAAAAEAERQRNERSFTVHARGESDAASIRSGKMLDGKKEEKKSKGKGRKWGFGGSKKEGGAAGDDASSIADGSSIREAGGYSRSNSAAGYHEDDGLAPGVEVLAQPAYAAYGASYQEGEPAAGVAGEEEYEPSVLENNHRKDYRGVRGILKGAGSYRQEDYALPKPAFPRTRAASFDAPQQQGRPGSPHNAALVNVIPSEAQVDGLVPSATSPRSDTQLPSTNSNPSHRVPPPSSSNPSSSSSPYSQPQMNVSAPTLSLFGSKQHPIRSASAPGGSGRRIAFAQNLSVHTTWPANVYDRRAEPATCNRLTPTLAQQIKEELNSFKMEEMDVHPSSRQLTHFFV